VPSLYLLLLSHMQSFTARQQRGLVVLAGGMLGLSAWLKESAAYLPVVLAFWLAWAKPRSPRNAIAVVMAVAFALAPCVAWNRYDLNEYLVTGGTLEANVRVGLNGRYINSDYNRIYQVYGKAGKDFSVHENKTFTEYGAGWATRLDGTLRENTSWNLREGVHYARDHKVGFVLTRIKKIADLHTPLSFLVRDIAFVYSGPLSTPFVRRVVIVFSLFSSCLLLMLGWLGIVRLYGTAGWSLFAC